MLSLRIAPPIVVEAQDALGDIDTTFNADVAIAIGNNPGGGTVSGTTMVSAVAGVVTFSDLSIDTAGAGYNLIVMAGIGGAISASFNVVPSCILRLNPSYDTDTETLTIMVRLGTLTPASVNVWATAQSNVIPIVTDQPLPVTDPPITRCYPVPFRPKAQSDCWRR